MSDVKKWEIKYDHEDGRNGTVEVTTEVQQSEAFKYGNGKAGALTIKGDTTGYDLRYAHGDLHRVMLNAYFGKGIVEAKEL